MSEQQTVNLNVSDIADAVKVIDYACEQGAFRGWDTVRQVQGVRDRLGSFVEAANAVTAPTEEAPQTASEAGEPLLDAGASTSRRQRRPRAAQ